MSSKTVEKTTNGFIYPKTTEVQRETEIPSAKVGT